MGGRGSRFKEPEGVRIEQLKPEKRPKPKPRKVAGYTEVILGRKEYGAIMHELETFASDKEKAQVVFSQPIGHYMYRVYYTEETGFIIIGKRRIPD